MEQWFTGVMAVSELMSSFDSDTKSCSVRRRRFLHDAGELAGEVALIRKAAVMADVGEAASGADDEMAGFLDSKVAQVFLGGHIKAGFELS